MSVRFPTSPGRTAPKRALPQRFSTLYRTHYDFVWRCALRLGADPADVDDVVQETFVIALRRLDEFTDEGAAMPSTWLFTILRNVLRNHARGRHRHTRKQQAYAEFGDERRVEAGEVERMLGIALLDRFLGSLDPDRRSVFVLAELEGHDSRAVGEALGINPNTARTRLRAARKAFAEAFEDDREAHEQLEHALARTRSEPPRASEESRERVLQAIAVGMPLELVGASSSGIGLGTWVGKLAIAGLASVAAITAVVLVERREREPTGVAEIEAPPPTAERPAKPAGASSAPASEPAIVVVAKTDPPKPAAPAKVERPQPPPPSDETSPQLEAMRTLADARAALIAGKPEDALRLVQAGNWPDQALTDRALALEIGALCALDRNTEAKAIADAHPDRWLLARDAACW
jgi:RNA polymerase sigma factor (sigma-70 family)